MSPEEKGWQVCDVGAHRGCFQWRPSKWLNIQKLKKKKKKKREKKHWWLSHGSLHHGLFLCSVLGIGYLAEVDTAAFSTDPYFGWPPIHCLVAIQIVWDGVLRHQWSWDAKEERKRQSGGRKRVSTRQEMTAGDQLWGLPWTLSVMWLVIRLIMIITTFNNWSKCH